MASTSFKNRVRVGGSGFTLFAFGGQIITFCQQVAHTSPEPVGGGVSAIQPIDEPYPIELITPAAAGPGQFTLNMYELFGTGGKYSKIWERLGGTIAGSSQSLPFGSFNNPSENSSTNLNIGTGPFTGAIDIVDVFIRQAEIEPSKLNVTKYVLPLGVEGRPGSGTPYSEEYMGCVITKVVDGEQIEVGTMEVLKQVTIAYRYTTRNGKASAGFARRDRAL